MCVSLLIVANVKKRLHRERVKNSLYYRESMFDINYFNRKF